MSRYLLWCQALHRVSGIFYMQYFILRNTMENFLTQIVCISHLGDLIVCYHEDGSKNLNTCTYLVHLLQGLFLT
jgi:hypothetical protein